MIVTPIASTMLHGIPVSVAGTVFGARKLKNPEPNAHIDTLHEFAGRACYQSWELPNPKTASNAGYMANIIKQQHFSVLEHGSVTFYVEGVSRSLTHELIRHRHLSYSELSQRYVDIEDAEMVPPPAYREAAKKWGLPIDDFSDAPLFGDIREEYRAAVATLTNAGYTRKQAREAARCLMPNATETKIVVTGNLRAWRDVLQKRWHVAADAEIREFAGKVLRELREIAPHSVADIPDEPFGTVK